MQNTKYLCVGMCAKNLEFDFAYRTHTTINISYTNLLQYFFTAIIDDDIIQKNIKIKS